MSTYSIGQMNQLGDALETAGFTPGEVTKLQQFRGLATLRAVLNGTAQIVVTKHVIDCDADPFVPENWKVEEHQKGGKFEWDPSQIELYLDKGQLGGNSIVGNKLRQKMSSKKIMNACVLDFLLAHPELIPEEWKSRAVFFWGTIYRESDGNLYVRYLCWDGGGWSCYYGWLVSGFNDDCPAALRK